ncbi:1,4-alpha-glucan branching protein GlgB [Ornithinimicrobium pratense]|uniref:1,4-alpha-glucan branching enzyme GlgB n=1 Tax=Ornithinimicrobium pratense TaxID=2593973 RepID=A0A5J6V3W2_9MICO|nr:1,4-alpha-glucan branching protein GlgB [Ornithinimicrobium pratense]QFG67851.1 alpha-D-glucose phosphate-specific phosphoglucomutase [Ornithinimicrobium pratense]
MPTLTPPFEEFLPDWVARQRWFRGKTAGGPPRLRRIGSVRWEDPLGEVGLEDHIVIDESGPEPVVYQIPLSYRAEAVAFMSAGLVGTAEHSELGTRYVYDATHDPVFAQVLLQHMYAGTDVPSAHARRLAAHDTVPALRTAQVLTGEQSNTSIMVQLHREGDPVIIKVFRVLADGDNPDVVVQAAISDTGSRQVPSPLGYVEGRWSTDDGEARGHLVFAQEFLPDTRDAWQGALEACRDEADFTAAAHTLGAATAAVHRALREAFGTTEPDDERRRTLVTQMRRRAEAAYADAPELAQVAAQVEAVYARLESQPLPTLQRIHGDYHLGQVLQVPDRGWVLLDFEGEPLRPLPERTAPDLTLRDVAGMLRSFDYAAASVSLTGERAGWARAARQAFVEGYAEESGEDVSAQQDVLDALELDKALYEASYEARNRPDWLAIPVAAVHRLVAGAVQVAPGPDSGAEHTAARETPTDPPTGSAAAPLSDAAPVETSSTPGAQSTSQDDADDAVPTEDSDDLGATEQVQTQQTQQTHETQGTEEASVAVDERTGDEAQIPDASIPDDDYGSSLIEMEHVHQTVAHPGDRALASGGVPHAPVAPPRGAFDLELPPLAPVGHRPGESAGTAAAGTEGRTLTSGELRALSASGWSGVVDLDPAASRDRAWQDAIGSPDVVTGRTVGGAASGDSADEDGGASDVRAGTKVTRRPLEGPSEPSAPHTRPLDLEEATDVVHGLHRNPHALLGAHPHEGHVTIRTLQPEAEAVEVVLGQGRTVSMTHETGGIWVAVIPEPEVPAYRLQVAGSEGARLVDEAYRHTSSLGETDLHLIGEGRHEELWRALGSHVMTVRDELGPVTGTRFAVWAPHALAVHVIGDFNGWNGNTHALRAHDSVGVWELFVPGVREGAHYKYDITGPDGVRRAKADPMARASEVPPFNNSVVTVSRHRWSDGDAAWMRRRSENNIHHGPMSIYEMHLGSWRQGLSYEQLADELVDYVADLGFTHVEFMPVMQHPYGGSWGYHVTGYFAADSRFGHEDGLRYLIDRLHCAGIGVILDWVPGHFATDPWALARFDGTPIYEHPDPRKGWHSEWGSYIFDFGHPQVRNFLVANATYWLEEFHADGLRVDGVASMLYLDYSRQPGQWVPNRYGGRENLEAVALLQETNATAYRRSPGVVMIAEESTSWPGVTAPVDEGGLGFGFKWNMGWMHDTLDYLGQSPYARAHHHHTMTFSMVYAFGEKYILPISHDEVVHGKGSLVRKMAGDAWQKFATMRAFLAYQWSHPGKQLLFMGTEFGQVREWADQASLSWELTQRPEHAGVLALVRDLNRLYHELPALWQIDHHEDGFRWLDANDASRNLYSYLRWGDEGPDGLRPAVVVLVNFSGVTQHQVHVGLPYGGRWHEALNTDAEVYGGSGQGNMGYVQAYDHPHQHQPFSALVTVPPMGAIYLVPDPEPEAATVDEEGALEPGSAEGAASEDSPTRHARAGQPARSEDLVDVAQLLAAYTEIVPDPDDVDQQVAFGTSGHRGSALDGAFNEQHILATTQAICDYRRDQGTDGPLFLGRDTHALSEPAWRSALEVLIGNGVDVHIDSGEGYTPTPAVSRAILQHNRETPDAQGEADGIVVTPSHNPPRDGGFKYNPPHGGPADTDATSWIADRANELLRAGLDEVQRVPFEQAHTRAAGYDFMGEYVRALPRVIDLDAIREAGVRIGADPLGGAAVDYWGAIAQEHGLDLTVVNPDVDPTWRFMTLDWDGKIRMDCSSPDAMASLIEVMRGEQGGQPRFDVATGNDADADRHGIVTPDAGLMNPNHYLAVAIDYLYGGARPDWPQDIAIGKTLVSSSMIDKVAQSLGQQLIEVPVGFKWFVPGLLDGSVGFGGEESAGASFLCRDGSVWSTDKDGIILALLAAEIIARTGRTPSQRYAELVAEHGDPAYARVDAPAGREQKGRLKKLSARDISATELAGEQITAVLTEAPGNDAAIGGVKVATEHAWFAARPSGTEDVYKIYAESFRGPEHLAQVQAEAQQVVDQALRG